MPAHFLLDGFDFSLLLQGCDGADHLLAMVAVGAMAMAAAKRRFTMPLLNQAGDDGAIAEGALQHEAFVEPCFQIVAEHILVEEVGEAESAARDL